MPLYEYKCEGCGETFEVIQKFSDEPLRVHEKCGGHVHKLMSAPAFQFKGTGWYVTDYAKGNANGPPKNEGKTESGKGESGKGESGKGESSKNDSSKSDSGKNDSGKSESGKSDSSSKSTDTATKTESKPSSSSSSKND